MNRPLVRGGRYDGKPGEFSTVDLGHRIETMFFPADGSTPSVVGIHVPLTLRQVQERHLAHEGGVAL